MNVIKSYYDSMADKLCKSLTKRNFDAGYFSDSESAVEAVISSLPDECSVSWGGSETLKQAGFHDALRAGQFNLLDREKAETTEETDEIYHKALSCDYYFMGTNAITADGKLVNIDGRGNRLAALIYGPAHVIIVAGMNKVVKDEQEALYRVKNIASPQNSLRLSRDTPCAKTGFCGDCLSPDCICSNTVITRRSMTPGRIKIVLIGEQLGY